MASPQIALRSSDFASPGPFAPAIERFSAGDPAAGLAMLEPAVQSHPDDPRGANFLGMACFYGGRYPEAHAMFARASTLEPAASVYAYNAACTSLLMGDSRGAMQRILQSLRGDELLPDAHRWGWHALHGCGQFDSALRALRDALRRQTLETSAPARADRIDLPGVTLCAIDCVDPTLAARALVRSMAQCRFGAVKLFTSQRFDHPEVSSIAIERIASLEGYSRFVMKGLADHVDTEHVLVVQWDGYAVNGEAWSDAYLACDYVGATWDEAVLKAAGASLAHDVGNGGFSLRSRRFLDAARDPRLMLTHPEDEHLCRTYRTFLETEHGIRFADSATANRFSVEANRVEPTTFGFHGSFNLCCFEPDPQWIRFEFLGAQALAEFGKAASAADTPV